MMTEWTTRYDLRRWSIVFAPMITTPRSHPALSRVRRLVGGAGVALAALTAMAAPALADGRPARTPAHRTAATQAPKRPSARERTKARAAAAAARIRASDRRTRATTSSSRLAARTGGAAPSAAVVAATERLRDSVVRVARAQIGVPYVLGGTTPDAGFDCSGLVRYVMNALHVRLPRTAAEQAAAGTRVARDESRLRPGDLVTFASRGEGVSHIGIYIGNGRMIHASTTAGQVIEVPLIRPAFPTIKPWRGARRVVAAAPSAGTDGRQ